MRITHVVMPIILLVIYSLLLGCASQKVGTSSSVVDYLYSGDQPSTQRSTPHLSLPLKVGIAFVPESQGKSRAYSPYTNQQISSTFTEAEKSKLLESVASSFESLEFVDQISIIPTGYLRARGGFENLDQLSNMYGVDVIALLSYDQMQFIDQDVLALSYWTLVGAYLVKGEKNDTSTLMDTAVYDIASRSLLFRAPGNSAIKGRSTPINLGEELREDSYRGFEEASKDMTKNLTTEIEKFKARLKQDKSAVKVSRRSGDSGSGAVTPSYFILILMLLGFRRYWAEKVTS